MGAYSLLTRKVGPRLARLACESGETCSAEDAWASGIIDLVWRQGLSVDNVLEGITTSHYALQARKQVQPLHYEELVDVVQFWLANVSALTERDVKKIKRVVALQEKAA
jgi:DSF synthase